MTTDNNGFTVHPAADLFPMMTADELQELATDIETNGLRFPIMMDSDGKVLIDGRNRLAACKLADVEPRFAKLPAGSDPLAFIASVNLMRRNLTKGQQAMALAMIYPEAVNVGRAGRSKKNGSLNEPFSKARLSQARSVLHHSRSLAEAVLNGITPLNQALETATKERQLQMGDEAKMARLQRSAPDLAEQVKEERLKIDEALGALSAREQRVRQLIDDGRRSAGAIAGWFVAHVTSILTANESGASITITTQAAEMIRSSYAVLFERVPVSDSDK